MTTYINNFTNTSAGVVALADAATAGCFAICPGQSQNPNWVIKSTLAQAILGPGATNVGPGTYDWIWDDGDFNIRIQRAGKYQSQILFALPRWYDYVFSIGITYEGGGQVFAQQINIGAANEQIIHQGEPVLTVQGK